MQIYFYYYIFSVALVESSSRPTGVQLVNTHRTNKHADPMDLVALAQTIQKVFIVLKGNNCGTFLRYVSYTPNSPIRFIDIRGHDGLLVKVIYHLITSNL